MYACFACSVTLGSISTLKSAVCTSEIDSTPPATTTSILSVTTCFDAVAIAIIPDEHCLSIVMPGTLSGSPAAIPANLPIFIACEPCCCAHPKTTSSTSFGSIPALSTASFIE